MSQTKPPPVEPRDPSAAEEPRSVIDTSKMSSGQRAALELTEAAREATEARSFASGLFMGLFELSRIRPFPIQSPEDRDQGDAFLQNRLQFLQKGIALVAVFRTLNWKRANPRELEQAHEETAGKGTRFGGLAGGLGQLESGALAAGHLRGVNDRTRFLRRRRVSRLDWRWLGLAHAAFISLA